MSNSSVKTQTDLQVCSLRCKQQFWVVFSRLPCCRGIQSMCFVIGLPERSTASLFLPSWYFFTLGSEVLEPKLNRCSAVIENGWTFFSLTYKWVICFPFSTKSFQWPPPPRPPLFTCFKCVPPYLYYCLPSIIPSLSFENSGVACKAVFGVFWGPRCIFAPRPSNKLIWPWSSGFSPHLPQNYFSFFLFFNILLNY